MSPPRFISALIFSTYLKWIGPLSTGLYVVAGTPGSTYNLIQITDYLITSIISKAKLLSIWIWQNLLA